MACNVSTSHPPCPDGHGCFRRLSYSSTCKGCPSQCRHPRISPGWLTFSRIVLTPSVVALVRPFRASPGRGWLPAFASVRVAPVTRSPVSVSPNLKRIALVEWVESGVVNPRSARCSRTSPITGMRLRAANRIPAGGRFPVNVYRMSGMCWHTSPTAAMAAVQGCGGILGNRLRCIRSCSI